MSVKWEEEAILLRLVPELLLTVDRTSYSPRHRLSVGFTTPLIELFKFSYDNENILRK